MKTTIYLVRHGEVYNPKNIFYGRLPRFGLSERGKIEASQTARFLKDKGISFIFSSPLLRARQTARIVQIQIGLNSVQTSIKLIEEKSSYQGKLFSDLDERQSEIYLKPLSSTDETIPQLAERMRNIVEKIGIMYKGKTVAVVSHGDPIMALKAALQNKPLDFQSSKVSNGSYVSHCEITKITIEDNETFTLTSVFKPKI